MLYKPNFCCNCGEKIDRTDWSLFSSRRFCPLCETENKGQDYFVRGLVAAGVILGVFGLSAWLRVPTASNIEPESKTFTSLGKKAATVPVNSVSNSAESRISQPANAQNASRDKSAEKRAAEQVNYCQAMTKKGTRCTRRIKSPGVCWQHARSQVSGSVHASRQTP